MNHREPPQLSVGARRALRCLSLLLLSTLAPKTAHSLPRSRPLPGRAGEPARPASVPYLVALGAPPLRFQRPAPPPDLVTHPAAAAPPVPALTPTESTVAQANAAAAQSAGIPPTATNEPAAGAKPKGTPPPAKAAPPRSILPDDTRPTVKPEDFLPFFQIPGTAKAPGDVSVIVPTALQAPAAAPVPPSSATYTQTPK
ncbi:MAG: hypothetical protein HZA93_00510 [Verrucomicrobia bacterium]|nr:hypothetical protein [Verrucomicrobiota bacterium]